jgi:endo-1,4-beta-xylanase
MGFAGQSTKYIEQAFRSAHEADPDALLFYNDNEGETVNLKSDAIYAMVRDFGARAVPIDGIGLQMHIFEFGSRPRGNRGEHSTLHRAWGPGSYHRDGCGAPDKPRRNSERYKDLDRQADVYRRIGEICVTHPGCTAIPTWGFTDKYSRIRSTTKGAKRAALIFDHDYSPKPAYTSLRSALREYAASPKKHQPSRQNGTLPRL